jgi:hypothetical protein
VSLTPPTSSGAPAAPGSLRAGLASPVALVRWLWAVYTTPGRPGRPTSQVELRWIYTAWLGAFLLKLLGSSWDVSWHFKWLRDDLAPPHLLNSVGTAVVIALVVFHSYSGHGVDRRALRLMQWGIGVFLVAIPLDILNHRINGLDITSWSPTHALLYLGTAVMLAGALRGWWLYAAPGPVRVWVSLALWVFFLENVHFPDQHQEYGVLSLVDYLAGHTTAEPSLLDFARAQGQTPTQFMLPVPSWVHPTWLVCAGLLTLVVARRVVGLRWTATAVAATYLAYRAVAWTLLVATGFPPSVLPVVLLVGAVLVDVAVTSGVPGWAAGVPVAAVVYGAAFLQEFLAVLPPWNWWSAVPVAVAFSLLWAGVDRLAASRWLARWRVAVEPGRAEVLPPSGGALTAGTAGHDAAHGAPGVPGASAG